MSDLNVCAICGEPWLACGHTLANVIGEVYLLRSYLQVAVEAMNKAERLLDNNFGFRSQEDIDAWNILVEALQKIGKKNVDN